MPNWFNRTLAMPKVKHSVFDLSNDVKTSIRLGVANPVGVEEIAPSDKILSHSVETFIRFAPLKFPTMHKIKVHTSNFYIPFRIILGEQGYEDFLNGKKDIVPMEFIKYGQTANPFVNTVLDYLGYDVLGLAKEDSPEQGDYQIILTNPLPFLAYLCIMRDWYADSNVQSSYMDQVDELIEQYRSHFGAQTPLYFDEWGDENADLFELFKVSYTKDYFNTARPQPQLGSEMYVLNRPLMSITGNIDNYIARNSDGVLVTRSGELSDVALNEGTTIRDLWKKEMLQRYFEIDNTFGSRIREKLAGHFGVIYSDQRLQIPQFCGGSNSYAQIAEVISTADTSSAGGEGLGAFSGKAIVADRSKSRKHYFEEHGYYITLLSLIPDNGYCRGMQRSFFKKNIFDFCSPEFNNVGWQDVYKGELFCKPGNSDNVETWGYQPRFSEYRYHPSRCTGAFRVGPEIAYHLNRNFGDVPPLNGDFIQVADVNRIFSSTDISDQYVPLYVDVYHHLTMSRPISYEPDSMHLY